VLKNGGRGGLLGEYKQNLYHLVRKHQQTISEALRQMANEMMVWKFIVKSVNLDGKTITLMTANRRCAIGLFIGVVETLWWNLELVNYEVRLG
jgi:hypothetical protein